ncbi:MAG: hypothetical protein ABI824_06085 [Acidobacteriota bacterium]
MFVFDTESRTDATQRLTFGSYQFYVDGKCHEEGLFFADDLPAKDKATLERYVATHKPRVVEEGDQKLRLSTRSEFVDRLYWAAYKTRCLLVGFNLPFDFSRVGFDFSNARGRFQGGFSLGLWSYRDESGVERPNHFRPRIGIKHIDSKRALKGFTSRNSPDSEDLIPEGSEDGAPQKGHKFRGHFLDLRTLAFALTDRGYSLADACDAFGVEHPKMKVSRHGVVTERYIDYNRRDVLATAELAEKLLTEYRRHPIQLQVTRAYSPASIGKSYLRAMGIIPVLDRQPDFPVRYLGFAQSAFYGGRTSAKIRKAQVPVVYTDFLSMYPTVNNLMGLWRFVTAEHINVASESVRRVRRFLHGLKAEQLFLPATWRRLTGFVKVIPNGDLLPSRAKYSVASNDWQVGLNYLYAQENVAEAGLWFSLPDVVVSTILTGKVPTIADAFLLEPEGQQAGLQPIKLRGDIAVDPRAEDFFKVVIEQRKALKGRGDLSQVEKSRLDKTLKVLANATSYGIYAEMNRQESTEKQTVTCHGIDTPFDCKVTHPEIPGAFCFPPLASLITGAARLMLALLEHGVSELGGTYAMEDTDSMAIVATEHGGKVPCAGGSLRTPDGHPAVKALSWKQVRHISERFMALSPYDRNSISGSILKIEDDNFDPKTKQQRQIYCVAISAKRYVLYVLDGRGNPVLLRSDVNNADDRWSEHGMGHLLNPSDPGDEDREWIAEVWLNIVRKSLKRAHRSAIFHTRAAVGRVTVSSPTVMRPFLGVNEGKPYCDQIKPFNFLLSCHVAPLGYPTGTDPTRFHLAGPFELNPNRWHKNLWTDLYSKRQFRITTIGIGSRVAVRVKTYGEVIEEYEYHPEAKCSDSKGLPCEKQTMGILSRRHVRIERIKYIGKESNSLEEVGEGLIHSEENIYTEYTDARRDEWETVIRPALKTFPLPLLAKETRLSRRTLIDLRAGRSRPHRKNERIISEVLAELAQLANHGSS